MKCNNCGALNDSTQKYCRYCGSHLEVEVLNIYDECENQNKNLLHESVAINEDYLDVSLLEAFIGNKYDSLLHGFSFSTLFFGGIYFLYRKFYSLFILYCGLSLFLFLLFPFNSFLSSFILRILFATQFKRLYINNAINKIEKIRKKYPSDFDELKRICRKKGGTSILAVLLFLFLMTIIILFVSLFFFYTIINTFVHDFW